MCSGSQCLSPPRPSSLNLRVHYIVPLKLKPDDQWSCIAHLSAEDMLKSAVIEENKFKHSPRVGADNTLVPKF